MKQKLRAIFAFVAAVVLVIAAVVYRTVETGRGGAQPSFVENLSPGGEMAGPKGIQFDAAGDLYVGDENGIIWNMGHGGPAQPYAELWRLQDGGGVPSAGGMAFDSQGNLYVACYGFAGGSVLRVDAGTRQVRLLARNLGNAASVLITRDNSHLWVSDFRSRGRLLRLPLAAPSSGGPDQVVEGLEYPNGMVFGKDEKTLYVSETYAGNVAAVDLAQSPPRQVQVINLKGAFAVGSLTGLEFDPRDRDRRLLYVVENIRGMFSVVDLDAQPARVVKQFRVDLMGGRPCPAAMAIRDGYLYFTDVWSCNPLLILLGIPKWHNHVYRFPIINLSAIY